MGVCCVKNDVTVVQIEEEPEEEPAEDDSEDKEDDSEDKEESVDEEDDEEMVRTLDTCCVHLKGFKELRFLSFCFFFLIAASFITLTLFPYRQKPRKMNCEALNGGACNKGAGCGFASYSSAIVVDVILSRVPGLGFF